jgi:hypothetical protein
VAVDQSIFSCGLKAIEFVLSPHAKFFYVPKIRSQSYMKPNTTERKTGHKRFNGETVNIDICLLMAQENRQV